jgi:Na+-transporting NADH:ubiquinone oxidoreductase subunit C
MAEDKTQKEQKNTGPGRFSNQQTVLFMVVLSLVCAFVLSVLAAVLQKPQEEAKEFDRSREMLVAARIYNSQGYFQVQDSQGNYIPAVYEKDGYLRAGTPSSVPSKSEVLAVVRARLKPFLVDYKGARHTFEAEKIDLATYLAENKKKGYADLPLKLAYEILPNTKEEHTPIGYIIPVSGFGLWDYIYGYLAVQPDGNSVIGISWYEHKETPGLGANIAEAPWQSQFPGKKIFQSDASGKVDFNKSSLGLTVVRGKVKDVLGDAPKAKSAVDGMAGATLTGNGVTKAYKDTLNPYRPFFVQLEKSYQR